ncbi:hypothetical protein ACIP4S_20550 [Streptomyces chartreusis]|uniref:hypothetical protein n=1 Tax=Streptomyces chartreusis TaxID=1969 RepID=UPI00382C7C93
MAFLLPPEQQVRHGSLDRLLGGAARLDLAATAVRVRLAITGATLAVIGHAGSWLALRLTPGAMSRLGEAS